MVGSLLARTGIRYLSRHPWQTWLTVTGIALGVAVVVAVDLANISAKRSFELSLQMVAGRSTHHILGGTQGIPETFYTELRTRHEIRESAPLISGQLSIKERSYSLLGVDPFAENRFRAGAIQLSQQSGRTLFIEPNRILISTKTAEILGVTAGDTLTAIHRNKTHQIQIEGLLDEKHPLAAQGLLIADIATAQELLNRIGTLDRIDLILNSDTQRERIEALLPPDLELVSADARNSALTQMTKAFHTNLSAMSLLALLVGAFLIYNTITFMVLQRRPMLGTLRAVGVTGRQLFFLVLTEAAVLAVAGALAGVLIGTLLGQGLVQLVTRTIDDLYYALEVSRFIFNPLSLLKGFILGLAVSLLAALLPALEAARSRPVTVQQHSSLHRRVQRHLPLLTGCGLLLLVLGVILAYREETGLTTGFLALALAVLGFSLTIPQTVELLAVGARKLSVLNRAGPTGRLAIRGISAGISRTGLAVAALSIAVATTIGVGIMISSFRDTVADWLDQSLNSDIYISLPGSTGSRADGGLPDELLEAVEQLPQVASIWLNRSTRVETQWGPIRLMAISDNATNNRGFNLKQGDTDSVRADFFAGKGVLISEPLAYHRELDVNDRLQLNTVKGKTSFPILSVFYDYTSSHGLIIMPRSLYREFWRDDSVSALGVYRHKDTDPQQLTDRIRQLASRYSQTSAAGETDPGTIRVIANSEIKSRSLAIFDRTFTITHVLRLLSVGVAFIGILSALMALQLERTSEFALLRATGATPKEVKNIIYLQTGIMGLFAGVLALPLGYLMSTLLIDVINLRSFGWSMTQQVPPRVLIEGVALAVIASLLAGIYPARRAASLAIAQALREE